MQAQLIERKPERDDALQPSIRHARVSLRGVARELGGIDLERGTSADSSEEGARRPDARGAQAQVTAVAVSLRAQARVETRLER